MMISKFQDLKVKLLVTISLFSLGCFAPFSAQADTLEEALISVYNKNPALQAERARLREIDETYIQARAQGRFSANASGSYGYTTQKSSGFDFFGQGAGGESLSVDGDPASAQVQIIQPLYQGGRVKALKQQAKSGILAARESLRAVENNLFAQAGLAYVDVIRDEEAARIRRNNVMVLDRQLAAADARFEAGTGTRTDTAQSRSRLASAEAGLALAEAQLEISRANYRRVVGRQAIDLQPVPSFVIPVDMQTSMNLARQNNPQLLASIFNEDAGSAAIDVARAAGRPTVSLNGSLAAQRQQLNGIEKTDQLAIAAQVTIPIFTGGLNKSRVRQAQHAKTRLAFETRDAERAIDQSVAQIWAQLEAARQVLISSQRQVEAAKIAFEGVSLEQSVGTRTQLDVLDAEQEVLNAKLTQLNSERDVNAVTFQLLSVIGVFDAQSISLDVDGYDPEANLNMVKDDAFSRISDKITPEPIETLFDKEAKEPAESGGD